MKIDTFKIKIMKIPTSAQSVSRSALGLKVKEEKKPSTQQVNHKRKQGNKIKKLFWANFDLKTMEAY